MLIVSIDIDTSISNFMFPWITHISSMYLNSKNVFSKLELNAPSNSNGNSFIHFKLLMNVWISIFNGKFQLFDLRVEKYCISSSNLWAISALFEATPILDINTNFHSRLTSLLEFHGGIGNRNSVLHTDQQIISTYILLLWRGTIK
jgi:hypothetical protein